MATAASPEAPIWIEINGRRRTCWSATPVDLETLVRGYLLTSGYIETLEQLQALDVLTQPAGCLGARVAVPEVNVTRVAQEQRHMREEGCGALHFVLCEPHALRRPRRLPPPPTEVLKDAFRTLFKATDAAYPDGGMHAAAVWTGNDLLPPAFDVGRHNTVDRALGAALGHVPLDRAGLLLSSRVSGAIALKAAKAGIAFLATRSIPTSLAAQVADCASLPIVTRGGRREDEEDNAS